ncbi:MAG: PQQ-binding-like beta-propeller repeat protein [Deltaproteobacteria bacterium]|nr:PQQ-binding-like beta-propeller repeat protein [Deltaproteobacteria bacterium]
MNIVLSLRRAMRRSNLIRLPRISYRNPRDDKHSFLIAVLSFCVVILNACSSVQKVSQKDISVPSVDWTKTLHFKEIRLWPKEFAVPSPFGNYVFQGSHFGFLRALNDRGKSLWQFDVPEGFTSSSLLVGERVFVGALSGDFYCLEASTGKVVWKYPTQFPIHSKPVYAEGKVFFLTGDDNLVALNASSGKWLWNYKRERSADAVTIFGSSSPALFGNKIFVGFSDGSAVALSASNGSLRWGQKISHGTRFVDVDSTPYVDNNRAIFLSYEGAVYSLNSETGQVQWSNTTSGGVGFVVDDGFIYVANLLSEVVAYDVNKGALKWTAKLEKSGSLTSPVIWKDALLVGDSNMGVWALDKKNGSILWKYKTKKGVSAVPAVLGDKAYVYSNISKLYALEWRKEK